MEPAVELIQKINRYKITLASRSPRRQQILRQLGIRFDVVIREFDESYPDNLKGSEIALHIASRKASALRDELAGNEIVITADTIVWCNGKVLGKPENIDDAVAILGEISGNTHEVITAVCIVSKRKETLFHESTLVTFERLDAEELRFYAEKFKPYDKAGAYGIQEWIGLAGCSRIEGSYFNVVGLPVHRVYTELKKFVE